MKVKMLQLTLGLLVLAVGTPYLIAKMAYFKTMDINELIQAFK